MPFSAIAQSDYVYRVPLPGLTIASTPVPPPTSPEVPSDEPPNEGGADVPAEPVPAPGLIEATPGPGPLAFGSVFIDTPQTRQVLFTNTGESPAALSVGTLLSPFGVSHDCPEALSGGQSCSATLSFSPVATGLRSTSFMAWSGETELAFSLTGTGAVASLANWTTGTKLAGGPGRQQDLIRTPDGLFFVETSNARVFRSTNNGQSWQTISLPTGQPYNKRIGYGAGVYLITGNNGSNAGYWRSTDAGSTWTWHTSMGNASTIVSIIHDGSKFAAFASPGPNYWTSTDGGLTWTARTAAWDAARQVSGVAYGNGVYIMSGYGNNISRSTNGINWTRHNIGICTTCTAGPPFYLGSNRFAVQDQSTGRISQDNGFNWTQQNVNFGATTLRGFAYGAGLFIAYGNSGTYTVSQDLVNWSTATRTPVQDALSHVHHDGTRFQFYASTGQIHYAQ